MSGEKPTLIPTSTANFNISYVNSDGILIINTYYITYVGTNASVKVLQLARDIRTDYRRILNASVQVVEEEHVLWLINDYPVRQNTTYRKFSG